MRKNEYKFSLEEILLLLFHGKKCPYCGNNELIKHTQKIYKGKRRSTSINMNLMYEDVFENTIIYECEVCRRKYTLKGLKDNIEVNDNNQESTNLTSGYHVSSENHRDSSKRGKSMLKKFLNFWLIVSLLILLSVAINDKNFLVIVIFSPFIIFGYLALRFFVR